MCCGLHYMNAGRFYSHDFILLPYVDLQVIIYPLSYFVCYILV